MLSEMNKKEFNQLVKGIKLLWQKVDDSDAMARTLKNAVHQTVIELGMDSTEEKILLSAMREAIGRY